MTDFGDGAPSEARRARVILVPEAHSLGAIGVIRSLGRAGYRVVAVSSQQDALGFRSNFAASTAVSPRYDSPEYMEWLWTILARYQIGLIIPSEAFLLATRSAFETLKPLLPLPADAATVYRAFSKIAVLESLLGPGADPRWRDYLPPSLILRRGDPIPSIEQITALGNLYYVKSDLGLSRVGKALMLRCSTASAVVEALRANWDSYDAILIQGFVPGMKAASAYCLDANGEVVTCSGVLGIRTTPHHGGMMSLRESWRHPEMERIALEWLRHLGWRGVAMIECKWDPESDQFWMIEINARYWGYLHLDLYAGVDVPRLQADRFFRFPPTPPPVPRIGVRCRHAFPGDAGWLLSRLKDRDVGRSQKVVGSLRFLADFANFRTRADLFFPGDRQLYWIEAGRYCRALLAGLAHRLRC